MPPNLRAQRFHIRPKSLRRHHSRMKITIRTLRLTERNRHVNPELTHQQKTLTRTVCPVVLASSRGSRTFNTGTRRYRPPSPSNLCLEQLASQPPPTQIHSPAI